MPGDQSSAPSSWIQLDQPRIVVELFSNASTLYLNNSNWDYSVTAMTGINNAVTQHGFIFS
jgi:hypothetical protein